MRLKSMNDIMRITVKLRRKIENLWNDILKIIFIRGYSDIKMDERDWKNSLKELQEYCGLHKNDFVCYVTSIEIGDKSKEKWVGGVLDHKYSVCFIPNSAGKVLYYDTRMEHFETWGRTSEGRFLWTGGGTFKNKIYGFPRTSNELIRINYSDKTIEEISLSLNYDGEHHYGGVITDSGKICQPPRNTDHLLITDIETCEVHMVYLVPHAIRCKLRYCGSVKHPNGCIYFLPERKERVIKFNPVTEQYSFIGNTISECMAFGGVVALDGNIYGFSLYKGILKIDVENNRTEMLCCNICFGCYGTKMGINGKLYGIPGDGSMIWEFDIHTGQAKSVWELKEHSKAKCAGGVVDYKGDIHMVPAFGNYIYSLKFNNYSEIPADLHKMFFSDCY